MKNRITLILISLLILSCNSKPKFTEEEKVEARNFISSINADIESIKISNSQEAYGSISPSNVKKMLELKKEALTFAEKISDEVLLKMHEELPIEYKKYKKGLSLRIQNLESGNIESEIDGSRMIDEWADWYSANKREIKIPK